MLIRYTILIACAMALASCATVPSDGCAGWRKITGKGASVEYLAEADPAFLAGVIAHAEFGKAQKCWK